MSSSTNETKTWHRGDAVLAISKGVYSTYGHSMYEARVLKVHQVGGRGRKRTRLDLRYSNDGTKEFNVPVFNGSGVHTVIHDDDS